MSSSTPSPWNFSGRARRTGPQPISYLMSQAVENPGLISLAAGLVDEPSLPVAPVGRQLQAMFAQPRAARVLQYGTTPGDLELRRRLVDHLASLDGVAPSQINASVEDMVMTTGSQQLLYLLTEVLVDPGDIVITDYPSYFVFTGLLESAGAKVRCVRLDEEGMIPSELEAMFKTIAAEGDLGRVKMVYLCDYHQNPSGITLSESRRPEILNIVRRFSVEHRILILEDAAYRELTYEGTPPRSIRGFDDEGHHVALAGTFSKPLSPGLKLGYGLLPPDLVEPVVLAKGNHDFGSSNLCQQIALTMLREGDYARHVTEVCCVYRRKCAAMLDALDRELGSFHPGTTHWTRPSGGLYVYLTLPPDMDTGRQSALFSRAIGEGVIYVPGEFCYPAEPTLTPPRSGMRLSFGLSDISEIDEGIARLGRAIRATFG
ncbi:MAG: PLP-dependent aminotransferase family protein [Phycisphaeraceae bacterium]|nr:PLP-dependent aminotransferase family protein [Phycisphaeraceae bacterium]